MYDRSEMISPYRLMLVDKFDQYVIADKSDHERFIAQLLSRPFRIPIPGYDGNQMCNFNYLYISGGYGSRALGLRKSGVRMALFDPYAEGALILYTPPELSVHDELKIDAYVIFVVFAF